MNKSTPVTHSKLGNPKLASLHPYPFQKLAQLREGHQAAEMTEILLGIGEPKHPTPALITNAISEHQAGFSNYPLTKGSDALRGAIANWLCRRFDLNKVDAVTQVLPVNGTREALFSFAQALINTQTSPLILAPNPFYQIYEGAALLAGADFQLLNCLPENDYQIDYTKVDDTTWQRCQILYLCSPSNPTGSLTPIEALKHLVELALKHNFVIASDECYSEIYFNDNKPAGLLEAAQAVGNVDYRNCVVFHSLSKRSNAPGMRSGFVAGDASILADFTQYRTYHGCAMPPPIQHASIAAWSDEQHVVENRRLYAEKFNAVVDILSAVCEVKMPQASFYLWLNTGKMSDTEFTLGLYSQQNVHVLPGSFLSREVTDTTSNTTTNPGQNHVRIALVADMDECITAAKRIKAFIESHNQ